MRCDALVLLRRKLLISNILRNEENQYAGIDFRVEAMSLQRGVCRSESQSGDQVLVRTHCILFEEKINSIIFFMKGDPSQMKKVTKKFLIGIMSISIVTFAQHIMNSVRVLTFHVPIVYNPVAFRFRVIFAITIILVLFIIFYFVRKKQKDHVVRASCLIAGFFLVIQLFFELINYFLMYSSMVLVY